jgi:hypothetical protein
MSENMADFYFDNDLIGGSRGLSGGTIPGFAWGD